MDAKSVERAPDFSSINRVLRDERANEGFLTWAFVRSFGELQILTRASYFMLLFVPLLAGMWPTVKVLVNRYNQSLGVAQEQMQAVLTQLPAVAVTEQVSPETRLALDAGLGRIAATLSSVSDAVQDASIQTSYLPMVWVVSFFASLLAVIAQTLYQSAAPQIVRADDKRSYIGKVIEEEKGLREMQEFELRDLIVETNEQYENAALTNRVACLVSVCFYILSLTCIGAIVVDQTLAVLNESGLFSNGGLL